MARKSAPIGKRWAEVLQIVRKSSLITSEGVAEQLWGIPAGAFMPTSQAIRSAELMLERMGHRRLVRRARPWSNGKLWAVGNVGLDVLAVIGERNPRENYRTSRKRRLKAKHRQLTLSPRTKSGRARCINENKSGTHGPPTHGCRCSACHETHRRSR